MNTIEPVAGAGIVRRLLGTLGRTLVALTLGTAVLTVAGLALVHARGEQVMVVISGSMTPTFRAGDAVLVRPATETSLQPGTVITFHAAGEQEHLTTHRIVSLRPRPEGLFLQTQGDANATPDPNFVPAGAVVGVMSHAVPHLGRWLAFVESPRGRTVVLGLPLLLLGLAQAAGTLRDLRTRPPASAGDEPRRRRILVPTTLVVVISIASGAVLARSTAALYTEQVGSSGNGFTTGAYCGTSTTYQQAVVADSPVIFHRFSETTGTTAANTGTGSAGTYGGGYTLGVGGATACEATSRAVRLNGSTGQVTNTAASAAAPAVFTLEAWFRTTTGAGKLVGFGNSPSGISTTYDRHLYLTNSGQVVFGVKPGGTVSEVITPSSYLDGRWHHVVATLGTAGGASPGMRLYVDGVLVVNRTTPTTALALNGFWRIGYDNLAGSPNTPTNPWYTGDLDEVAVYTTTLTAAKIATHYAERRG